MQASLAELRRLLLANDVAAIRKLLYTGGLDWMRERIETRDWFAVRDRVNHGDVGWLRERFITSDANWLRHAVLDRDVQALRMVGRIGGLDWLESVIPVARSHERQQRLEGGDIEWFGERSAGWPLDERAPTPMVDEVRPRHPPVAPEAASTERPKPNRPAPRPQRSRGWRVAGLTAGVILLSVVAVGSLAIYDWHRGEDESTTRSTPRVAVEAVSVTATSSSSTTSVVTTRPPVSIPPAPTPSTTPPPAPLSTDVVYFPADTTTVPASADTVLDTAAAKIKANPGLTVRLNGVADPSGSAAANRLVSQRRAESVQAALVARGAVAKFEIVATGGDSTVEPALARRVETIQIR